MTAEQQIHDERIAELARQPILALPDGETVALQDGFIPLLIDYTHEDKAAKGLRKGKTGNQASAETAPVYYTALEAVRDNEVLLLTGPPGSGKTTFANYLCSQIYQSIGGKLSVETIIYRNESGQIENDNWDVYSGSTTTPFYHNLGAAHSPSESLELLINSLLPDQINSKPDQVVLLILDAVESLEESYAQHLQGLVTLLQRHLGQVRLLLLGDAVSCGSWVLPSIAVKHSLLPLLQVQRREAVKNLLDEGKTPDSGNIGTGTAASNPALFALAVQASHPGDVADDLLDAWLAHVRTDNDNDDLPEQAYRSFLLNQLELPSLESTARMSGLSPALKSRVVQSLLAARYLAGRPEEEIVRFFQHSPYKFSPIIQSVLSRLGPTDARFAVIRALLKLPQTPGRLAALLGAGYVEKVVDLRRTVITHIQDIITEELLPISQRVKAGSILSTLGDPRDLSTLASIPAGTFRFGSETHPNSSQVGMLHLPSYRIGIYPVVNQDYGTFIHDTNRQWLSPEQHDTKRRNAPATDLTWHDARAYCIWLTTKWRREGRITIQEEARLPTEPEWEHAARGEQGDGQGQAEIYPWGTTWQPASSNNDTLSLNDKCCVGLFPSGKSPYGCYDMTGQVWEWCSTLWGTDMAMPDYKYPWTSEDGRERLDGVDGSVRRVLRGGCFSSGFNKATCTYRGSLEPDGYWRGNGFRIVVAKVPENLS